jgi:hypothetical protein
MTFKIIEEAAAKLPPNTEPASEDVLIEQSFPCDEQLSNLFHPMLLQTSGPRVLMPPLPSKLARRH